MTDDEIANSTTASHTYQAPALDGSTTYCWKAEAIDPGVSNSWSAFSSTQLFTTLAPSSPPAAPTLLLPVINQAGVSVTPEFRLSSIDANGDYVRYRIYVYQSNCSTLIRTIDQTLSQTGRQSQSAQAGTAYTSAQAAIHNYQTPALTINTTYCWKGAAIDPGGNNTWSSDSATRLFTTSTGAAANTEIRGGTNLQ